MSPRTRRRICRHWRVRRSHPFRVRLPAQPAEQLRQSSCRRLIDHPFCIGHSTRPRQIGIDLDRPLADFEIQVHAQFSIEGELSDQARNFARHVTGETTSTNTKDVGQFNCDKLTPLIGLRCAFRGRAGAWHVDKVLSRRLLCCSTLINGFGVTIAGRKLPGNQLLSSYNSSRPSDRESDHA